MTNYVVWGGYLLVFIYWAQQDESVQVRKNLTFVANAPIICFQRPAMHHAHSRPPFPCCSWCWRLCPASRMDQRFAPYVSSWTSIQQGAAVDCPRGIRIERSLNGPPTWLYRVHASSSMVVRECKRMVYCHMTVAFFWKSFVSRPAVVHYGGAK